MKLLTTLLLFTAIAIAGCTDTPSGNNVPTGQRYLFEIEYRNSAWVYAHSGTVIDWAGNLYSYDHSDEPWNKAQKQTFTEAELRDKYSHFQKFIKKLDQDELRQFSQLISGANSGQLSEPKSRCADYGGLTYMTYQYDSTTRLYTPVTLYTAGDWTVKNTSDEANRIFKWLRWVTTGDSTSAISCGYED